MQFVRKIFIFTTWNFCLKHISVSKIIGWIQNNWFYPRNQISKFPLQLTRPLSIYFFAFSHKKVADKRKFYFLFVVCHPGDFLSSIHWLVTHLDTQQEHHFRKNLKSKFKKPLEFSWIHWVAFSGEKMLINFW